MACFPASRPDIPGGSGQNPLAGHVVTFSLPWSRAILPARCSIHPRCARTVRALLTIGPRSPAVSRLRDLVPVTRHLACQWPNSVCAPAPCTTRQLAVSCALVPACVGPGVVLWLAWWPAWRAEWICAPGGVQCGTSHLDPGLTHQPLTHWS